MKPVRTATFGALRETVIQQMRSNTILAIAKDSLLLLQCGITVDSHTLRLPPLTGAANTSVTLIMISELEKSDEIRYIDRLASDDASAGRVSGTALG